MNANLIETIGITLFHALWQGALIASILALVHFVVLRRARPVARLAASWSALAVIVFWTVHTFVGSTQVPSLKSTDAWLSPLAGGLAGYVGPIDSMSGDAGTGFPGVAQLVGIMWLVGMTIAVTRLALGWVRLRRLCQDASPISDRGLVELFEKERIALRIREKIQLKSSHQIDSPVMAGFLWPVVIVPTALLGGVPVQHLRALLCHELAHYRRWDYVTNLILAVVEAVYFFHPAVWWIAHTIRVEREHACDDLVIGRGVGVAAYGRALAAVEAMRRDGPMARRLALAADGGWGSTLARIERLAANRGLIPIRQGIIGDRTLFHRMLACFFVGGMVVSSAKGQLTRMDDAGVLALGTDYEAFYQQRIAAIGQAVAFLDQPVGWADHGTRLFAPPVVVEKNGRQILPGRDEDRLFEDLPNEWLLRHRLDFLNANLPSSDQDGDGFTVLEEFRAGTDPTNGREHPLLASKLRLVSRKGQFYRIRFDASPSGDRAQLRPVSALSENRQVWIRKTGETTPDGRMRVSEIGSGWVRLEDLTTGKVHQLKRGETVELPTWFAEFRLDLAGEKPFFVREGDAFRLEREPDVTYRLVAVADEKAEIAPLGSEADLGARIDIK